METVIYQIAHLVGLLGPMAAHFGAIPSSREADFVDQARQLLGALDRNGTGSLAEIERLRADLDTEPEKVFPKILRLAHVSLKGTSTGGVSFVRTVFGTVPELPIAPEALPAAREFVQTRLEVTTGILERLRRLRVATSPYVETLEATTLELLAQVEQAVSDHERIGHTLSVLSCENASSLCREVTSHYLQVHLLETLF